MKDKKYRPEAEIEIDEKDLPKAEGLIIKATGGFYYVRSGETTYECRARGVFRKERIIPLVGDCVEITVDEHGKNSIYAINERRNFFKFTVKTYSYINVFFAF